MSLSTEADVAAAEGDLAALRVHADRLADGFVKRRLARHLETVADEVAAARRALATAGGDAPTSAPPPPFSFCWDGSRVDEPAAVQPPAASAPRNGSSYNS